MGDPEDIAEYYRDFEKKKTAFLYEDMGDVDKFLVKFDDLEDMQDDDFEDYLKQKSSAREASGAIGDFVDDEDDDESDYRVREVRWEGKFRIVVLSPVTHEHVTRVSHEQ